VQQQDVQQGLNDARKTAAAAATAEQQQLEREAVARSSHYVQYELPGAA
jgi:hypothetical protein